MVLPPCILLRKGEDTGGKVSAEEKGEQQQQAACKRITLLTVHPRKVQSR
jgi:hypothetical protein